MNDLDDDQMEQRIAASIAKGIVFTEGDLLQLIHRHSLDELALIVAAFQNEAFAVLREPEAAQRRMLELVLALDRFLSEDDQAILAACINDTLQGYVDGDNAIIDRLLMFDYAPRGDGVAIAFPDEDMT